MLFFYLAALPVVIAALVTALLWLPSKTTGWFVRLDVGLAWFAALATLILVPTDVATTLLGDQPSYLTAWWLAAYWYGFLVQVLVLPIHMEFTRSGEFTIWDRILQSIRSNLIYYAILLGVALAGLLLLLLTGHLKASNVVGFCIAFSNAYGLIAGIFLLGFGLVAVPKQLWKCADLHGELRRLEHQAGSQAERAVAAHRRLSAAVLTTRKASVLFASHDPMRPCMDTVLALANRSSFRLDPSTEIPDESELDYFDKHDLARLRRLVKAALKDYEREKALYVETVQAYLRVEEILDRLDSGRLAPPDASLKERLAWVWRCHLHYWAFRLAAVLCACCSLSILVAEATISGVLPNTSLVSLALHRTGGNQFATELLCLLCLAYPCACAYYAIYRLGQFSFYRLVPRHTDAYSLCYSALLMTRFAPPLAFNFMAAVAMPASSSHSARDVTDTAFYRIFGELMMRQPLIGWQFTTFVPLALVPYMLLLALGAFNPLVGGISRLFTSSSTKLTFEDDWEDKSSLTSGGRRLLRMESENRRNGLPLGQTIEPAAGAGQPGGAQAGALLGVPGPDGDDEQAAAPWWRRMLGDSVHSAQGAGAVRPKHSVEALEARGRLSRALGRGDGGGGGGAAAAASGGGGVFAGGAGGREGRLARVNEDLASPTRRLLSGEESSDGSSEQAEGPRRGMRSGARSPLHSVDVESVESTEDSHARLSWFPKFGRK
ncbi:hypothetical protein N2152v2_000375 [Parachlorella kessleri]